MNKRDIRIIIGIIVLFAFIVYNFSGEKETDDPGESINYAKECYESLVINYTEEYNFTEDAAPGMVLECITYFAEKRKDALICEQLRTLEKEQIDHLVANTIDLENPEYEECRTIARELESPVLVRECVERIASSRNITNLDSERYKFLDVRVNYCKSIVSLKTGKW